MLSFYGENLLLQSLHWLSLYIPSLYAGFAAMSVSALMELRAHSSIRDVITGAGICGIVGVTISSLLQYLGLPPNGGAFAGAMIGLLGVTKLSEFAQLFIFRRTESKKNPP